MEFGGDPPHFALLITFIPLGQLQLVRADPSLSSLLVIKE